MRARLTLTSLSLVCALAGVAHAQEGGSASPSAGSTGTTSTPVDTGAAGGAPADTGGLDLEQPYGALLQDALSRIVQRDAEGAEKLLRAAIDKDSTRPEAYCHLGDAQRVAGELEEALASYQSCGRFADGRKDARYARIARSNEAITLERMPGQREQARAVYEALSADEDPSESPAWALASERLKRLAAAGLLETVYAPVRERIAQREAETK